MKLVVRNRFFLIPTTNPFLRHSYTSFCLNLIPLYANSYSFHHGVLFFPPWRNFLSTMVERKEPHGGKSKHLLRFSLAVAGRTDKSNGAATQQHLLRKTLRYSVVNHIRNRAEMNYFTTDQHRFNLLIIRDIFPNLCKSV